MLRNPSGVEGSSAISLFFGPSGRPATSEMFVVLVADRKTLPVLEHGQAAILSLIKATTYTVIVPDNQVTEFRARLDSRITVQPEGLYVTEFLPTLKRRYNGTHERFGWYLQQFIKLAAVKHFSEFGKVLVWDADTVPLRKLHFFSRDGVPSYFTGRENHAEYFSAITRALGLVKLHNFSFISQCFPVAPHHAKAFFENLRELSSQGWWGPLIDSVDFTQSSGFSEYETMGTFILQRFPQELTLQKRQWLRNGWKIFRGPHESFGPWATLVGALGISHCSFESHQAPRGQLERFRQVYNLAFFILRSRNFFPAILRPRR